MLGANDAPVLLGETMYLGKNDTSYQVNMKIKSSFTGR